MTTANPDALPPASAPGPWASAHSAADDYSRGFKCTGIALVVFFYLASISNQWYVTPDSATYLMLGENLATGEGFSLFGQPHTKFPPGFPAVLAGWFLLGLSPMWWLNGVMVATGLATLYFVYRLLMQETHPKLAYWLWIASAVAYEMYGASVRQLSDLPFMLFVVFALWQLLRPAPPRWSLPAAVIALSLATWFRVAGIPLCFGFALGIWLERQRWPGRQAYFAIAGLTLGVMLSASWYYARYQLGESIQVAGYTGEVSDLVERDQAAWLYAPFWNFYETGSALCRALSSQPFRPVYSWWINWLPCCIGLAYYAAVKRRWIVIVPIVCYVGSLVLIRPMIPRYFLPIIPWLFLYYITGLYLLFSVVPKTQWLGRTVAYGMLAMLILMNTVKDSQIFLRIHTSDFYDLRPEWRGIPEVVEFLAPYRGTPTTMMGDNAWVLAYLADLPALRVDRKLSRRFESPQEVAAYLDQSRIDLVIRQPKFSEPYCAGLHAAVACDPRFALVYDAKGFQVYRRERLAARGER